MQEEYRPGSILVTGAAGFIESHVAAQLVYHHPDCIVVGLDKMAPCATAK
jgi:dTDP-D-glucose 4,6-dehydratase